MKNAELVLTEIAGGQVKCFCHGKTRSWKRFTENCCQILFDEYFGMTACMWHLLKHTVDRYEYETLVAYHSIGSGELDGLLGVAAGRLRIQLDVTEVRKHFWPRNVVKYANEKEFMAACPPIPKDLLSVSDVTKNKLVALYDNLVHTRVSEIKQGKVLALRFETDREYMPVKSRKVTMSSFVEYLRYVTHKNGIMRVVGVDNKSNPLKIETENRSGPNLTVALTTIGSYELV